MRNNNKLIGEINRMLELSEGSSKKREILKDKFNKKIIKEIEGLDFSVGDDDSDDEGANKAIKSLDTWNYEDDISKELKLALLTDPSRGIDRQKALNAGFSEDDFIKREDLTTDQRTSGLDVGGKAVYIDKRAMNLYKLENIEDFESATKKGKVFIKTPDTSFYKWLTTKDLNAIGINKSTGKISKEGNATLNFLARVLSGKNLRDGEQSLIDLAGKENSKDKSLKILTDFYNVSATNFLPAILNLELTPTNLDDIVDGVTKALLNLAGISGESLSKKDTNWNGNSNIGPWILQVAKNYVKDRLKKDTDKPAKTDIDAEEFLQKMLKNDGIITIVSSKKPSHEHYASKVESVGDKWHYLYDNVEDAIDDLKSSNTTPAHHMKVEYVSTVDYGPLYGSERIAPISMSDEMESDMEGKMGEEDLDIEEFDKSTELEVKNLLGDVVEFMSKDVKKYGLSKKHSTELNPDKKATKIAKDNIVNFIYNFLLGMTGATKRDWLDKNDVVRDVEESGKVNKEVMKSWIRSQNEKMMNALKGQSDKSEEELKGLAKKAGLLINDDDKSIQNIWNGFKDYLEQHPEVMDKLIGLVGKTSPEGYEQEIELALEQRIRAKIQKILRESFVILKEDEVDVLDADISQQIKIVGDDAKRYELKDADDERIENINKSIEDTIINNSPIKWKYTDDNYKIFRYIIHVLASLYHNLNDSQKRNVMNQILSSLYGSPKFIDNIANKVDPKNYMSTDKRNEYVYTGMSTPKDGLTPVEVALNTFQKGKGGFFSWLQNLIVGHAKNAYTTDMEYSSKGEKGWKHSKTDSFDMPLDNDEQGGARTLGDTITQYDSSKEEKEERQHISQNILKHIEKFLIEKNLLKGKLLQLWNLMDDDELWVGNSFNNQLAANKMGIKVNAVRQLMFTINKIIENAVVEPQEELINYLVANADFNIKNTHAWKEYEETGKFNASDWKVSKKSDNNDSELNDDFMLENFKNLSEENIVIMKNLLEIIKG